MMAGAGGVALNFVDCNPSVQSEKAQAGAGWARVDPFQAEIRDDLTQSGSFYQAAYWSTTSCPFIRPCPNPQVWQHLKVYVPGVCAKNSIVVVSPFLSCQHS